MILKQYRKELPVKPGTGNYPLPAKHVLIELEKIWIDCFGLNPRMTLDVACTTENKRYENGLTLAGPSFDKPAKIKWKGHIQKTDALHLPWYLMSKWIYCMPPYNKQIPWIKKCRREANKGCVIVGIFGIHHTKEQKWYKKYIRENRNVYFYNLGRLRIDQWKNSNVNHVFCLFGRQSAPYFYLKDLNFQLENFIENLKDRVTVNQMSKSLHVSKYTIMSICHLLGIISTNGEPLKKAGNKILRSDMEQFVKPAVTQYLKRF